MGDQGNSSSLGGSGSNNLFGDASLGDALTGGSGDIFGNSSSVDLSNLFADAGLGSSMLGDASGLGGAFSTVTDPSGAGAAALSTTPPADAAGTPSGADPSGNIGGTQSGGAPQPGQPQQPARPVTPTPQDQSPLGQLAKMVKGAFGLGALPTAGGPTGFTALPAAGAGAAGGAGLGALAGPLAGAGFLLPFMTNPTQTATGVEAPRTLGRAPTGPPDPTQQPARPVTPTPPPAGAVDPTIAAGGPGAGAAQPPTDPAQPAPAAPDPAQADLPTKKGPQAPDTSEAGPEPSQGLYGPTGGGGGIGEILRDVLGLALANPTTLPMLAQLIGGMGRRRGGIPPWAYHGMTPFMRGQGRGFGGFRGGFLRPGYYPRRQGGWGFHPGGYHPGWGAWAPGVGGNQPMPSAGGQGGGGGAGEWQGANTQSGGAPDRPGRGADQAWSGSGLSSNRFLNTLVGQESGGGQNIVSRTDRDSRGLTLAQGGNPAEISQGYFQIQNHPGGTWSTYGRAAGIDLAKYPTPRSAPLEVQWQVASRIPIRAWGHDTQVALQRRGFRYSSEMTLGQVAQANGGVNPTAVASNPSSSTSRSAPGAPRANITIRDPANPIFDYPAKTETGGGAPPVQSDDFASAG